MFFGFGNSVIARKLSFARVNTVQCDFETHKVNSALANWNLSGFRVILFLPHMSNHCRKLASKSSAQCSVLSMHLFLFGMVETTSS